MIQLLVSDPILFFIIAVILIISIMLHELGHGWAAVSQGDDTPFKTGHLTFNPVVHMGWISLVFLVLFGIAWGAMPINPAKFRSPKWGNIIVSAAGPIANLIVALLSIGILIFLKQSRLENNLSLYFFQVAAQMNLILFMFNLLPIPPLDGFHVLSEFWTPLKPMKSSPFGLLIFMILFITGVGDYLFEAANLIIKVFLQLP